MEQNPHAGDPSYVASLASVVNDLNTYAGRLVTAAAAEIGPLGDMLKDAPRHWWEFRKRRRHEKLLGAAMRLRGIARTDSSDQRDEKARGLGEGEQ